MKKLLGTYIILFILFACGHQKGKKNQAPHENSQKKQKSVIKPPTIYSDTLKLDSKVAVFYYPDSNQLATIKAGLDSFVFDAVIHEYEYQIRFVHTVLDNAWPKLKVVEAKNARYLLFIKADKRKEVIDLNTKYDPYGLFLFDPEKDPQLVDMMNSETAIWFYFGNRNQSKNLN